MPGLKFPRELTPYNLETPAVSCLLRMCCFYPEHAASNVPLSSLDLTFELSWKYLAANGQLDISRSQRQNAARVSVMKQPWSHDKVDPPFPPRASTSIFIALGNRRTIVCRRPPVSVTMNSYPPFIGTRHSSGRPKLAISFGNGSTQMWRAHIVLIATRFLPQFTSSRFPLIYPDSYSLWGKSGT